MLTSKWLLGHGEPKRYTDKNMINNHHQRRPMPQIMLSHAIQIAHTTH